MEKLPRSGLLLRDSRFTQVDQPLDPSGGLGPTGDQLDSSSDSSSAGSLVLLTRISASGALSYISVKNYVSSKRYWINEIENAQKKNVCGALTTFKKHEVQVMEGWPLSFSPTEAQSIRHSENIIYPCASFCFKMWSLNSIRSGFNNFGVQVERNKFFRKRCHFKSKAKRPTQPSLWPTLILYVLDLNLSGNIIPGTSSLEWSYQYFLFYISWMSWLFFLKGFSCKVAFKLLLLGRFIRMRTLPPFLFCRKSILVERKARKYALPNWISAKSLCRAKKTHWQPATRTPGVIKSPKKSGKIKRWNRKMLKEEDDYYYYYY